MRNKWLIPAAIVFAGLVYAAGVTQRLPFVEDTSVYLNLARSMADGRGMVLTSGPRDILLNFYPPVYPALLAPLVTLFNGAYAVFESLSVVLAVLVLVFLARNGRELLGKGWMPVTLLLAFNAQFAMYGRSILSEIPFTLFALLSLWYVTRYARAKETLNVDFACALVFIFLAAYTRLIGFVLAPAAALYLFLKKERGKALVSLSFLLVLVPWLLMNLRVRSSYIAEFSECTPSFLHFVSRWTYNLAATVGKELPDLFFFPWLARIDPRQPAFILKAGAGAGLALLLVRGLARKVKEEGTGAGDVFALIYLPVSFAWTYHGARFLVPLLPFFILYLLKALEALATPVVFRRVFLAALAAGVCACCLEARGQHGGNATAEETSFVSAVDWLQAHAPRGTVAITRHPHWVNVYTGGIRGAKFLRDTDTRRQMENVRKANAAFVVIDHNRIFRDDASDYLAPLVRDYPSSFEKVYASPQEPSTLVYRVKEPL